MDSSTTCPSPSLSTTASVRSGPSRADNRFVPAPVPAASPSNSDVVTATELALDDPDLDPAMESVESGVKGDSTAMTSPAGGFLDTANTALLLDPHAGSLSMSGPVTPAVSLATQQSALPNASTSSASLQSTGTSSAAYASEEITTIFVVGFPEDMQEREFLNIFTFSVGFEAATLKTPAGGPHPVASTTASLSDPALLTVDTVSEPYAVQTASMSTGAPVSMHTAMGSNGGARKQIIGFAKFRSRTEALEARDLLNGRRIDPDRGCILKAEMAKKNLRTRRSSLQDYLMPTSAYGHLGPYAAAAALHNLAQGQSSVGTSSTYPLSLFGPASGNQATSHYPGAYSFVSSRHGQYLSSVAGGGSGRDFSMDGASLDAPYPSHGLESATGPLYDPQTGYLFPNPYDQAVLDASGPLPLHQSHHHHIQHHHPFSYISFETADESVPSPSTDTNEGGVAGDSDTGETRDQLVVLDQLSRSCVSEVLDDPGVQAPISKPPMSSALATPATGHGGYPSGPAGGSSTLPSPSFQDLFGSHGGFESAVYHNIESQLSKTTLPTGRSLAPHQLMYGGPSVLSFPTGVAYGTPLSMHPPTHVHSSHISHRGLPATVGSQPPTSGPLALHPLHAHHQQQQPQQQRLHHPLPGTKGSLRHAAAYATLELHGLGSPSMSTLAGQPSSAHATVYHTYAVSQTPTSQSTSSGSASHTGGSMKGHPNAATTTSHLMGMGMAAAGGGGGHAGSSLTNTTSTLTTVTTTNRSGLSDQNNPPCNTLYVGNLPPGASEEELRQLFSERSGYKRLLFRNKANGPMCFVEFESIALASNSMQELHGHMLSNSTKGGIRLSFSKNPLGVRNPTSTAFFFPGTAMMAATVVDGDGSTPYSMTPRP